MADSSLRRATGLNGVLALLALCCCACRQDARPNVLLISLDTLRADRVGSYGYERPTTPFLDELAARGVRFSHAFVNTHCTPQSHATLFTSLYQETHGVGMGPLPKTELGRMRSRRSVLAESHVTLAEILRDAGYLTLAVTEGGFMDRYFGLDQGFVEYYDSARTIDHGAIRLRRMLRRHADDPRPVFALLHTYEVHEPYTPPESYRAQFGWTESPYEATTDRISVIRESGFPAEDVRYLSDMYDAELRFADDTLRDLFHDLDAMGFLDESLVVVISDHGEEFREHGELSHRDTLYEEILRVPLLIAGTGIEGGRVDDRMASLVDVTPTILARLGLTPSARQDGRDLLAPASAEEDPAVFAQFGARRYAVRTRRWKLIDTLAPEPRVELYDLEADPRELDDAAAREPEIVAALRARIERWRATAGP
jgi:arylsulfatase A-like enzyme